MLQQVPRGRVNCSEIFAFPKPSLTGSWSVCPIASHECLHRVVKNWAVESVRHDAQDLSTRTGALPVPKGYRVSERLVARLANFNQGLLPTVIRMRKTVT